MRGSLSTLVTTIVAALFALIATGRADAQVGLIGAPLAACVAPVRAGDTAQAMLATATRFDCTTRQTRFGSGDYWVRAVVPGDIARDASRLRSGSVWQQRATLWAAYADGALYRVAIDDRGAARRIQLGAIIEQRLPVRHAALRTLLWRVEGSANLFGIVLAPRLATPEHSQSANLRLGVLYGGFAGMAIALLVYNLAIWVALRYRFQLVYCAMLATLLVYAASSSGALAWMIPDTANTVRLRINYLSLALAGASALLFARHFFESGVFAGWLSHATKATVVLLATTALLFAIAAPWHIALLNRAYTAAFLLELAITLPILWRAWRRSSRYLWLFAACWAAPIMLAALRVAGSFGFMRWNFLLDNSTLAAMAVEALLSSLAIAYRIRMLTEERDDARGDAIAALELADSDPLTGLANRRAFLRDAIGRTQEQVLLLADIDHFKGVNDAIGHDGGDEVLRIVARALRLAAPAGAVTARLGGEEFAILVPAGIGLTPADILSAVRAERTPFDIGVTISVGLAYGTIESDAAWKAIYRRADRALYEAKAAGRDRARYAAPALAA